MESTLVTAFLGLNEVHLSIIFVEFKLWVIYTSLLLAHASCMISIFLNYYCEYFEIVPSKYSQYQVKKFIYLHEIFTCIRCLRLRKKNILGINAIVTFNQRQGWWQTLSLKTNCKVLDSSLQRVSLLVVIASGEGS